MFCSLYDIYLRKPKKSIEVAEGQNGTFTWAHASMQGWRKSMVNPLQFYLIEKEDAVICLPNFTPKTHLFGILDGHGGSEVSYVVSQKFPEILKCNKNFQGAKYETALKESFKAMDEWLLSDQGKRALIEQRFQKKWNDVVAMLVEKKTKGSRKQQLDSEAMHESFEEYSMFKHTMTPNEYLGALALQIGEESGTTANIILIDQSHVYCANIGDSRSVAIHKNKPLILSFDHKPENRLERQRIKRAGVPIIIILQPKGFVQDGRVCGSLALSRAFADFQYKGETLSEYMVHYEPEIVVQEHKNMQMILMGCDGIWEGQVSDYGEGITQKVFDWLESKRETNCLESLMHHTIADRLDEQSQFGLDNMSCVLLNFKALKSDLKSVKQVVEIKKISSINKKIKKNN